MVIIGLTGKMGVGKDTVAAYLQLKYGFTRLANADYLKQIAKKLSWNGEKDVKGRKFLQNLGVAVREYREDFWISRVVKQIEKAKKTGNPTKFVITDIRFINEAEAIKKLGGMVVRVVRDTGIDDKHISEVEMDNYKVDATINNDSSYDELYKEVDGLWSSTPVETEARKDK